MTAIAIRSLQTKYIREQLTLFWPSLQRWRSGYSMHESTWRWCAFAFPRNEVLGGSRVYTSSSLVVTCDTHKQKPPPSSPCSRSHLLRLCLEKKETLHFFFLHTGINSKMHRTYSMRQSRAPTASQIQNPPPPISSTKTGRFFGKANIGELLGLFNCKGVGASKQSSSDISVVNPHSWPLDRSLRQDNTRHTGTYSRMALLTYTWLTSFMTIRTNDVFAV